MSTLRIGAPGGKLSVLLYDADPSVLDAYSSAFRRIFALADYEVETREVVSGNDSADSDMASLFETAYFDVLISDVSLGDIGNQLGLRFLTMIKDRHPDIFTVAFTGLAISYQKCSNKHRFDLYVDKQRIEVPRYQEFVASQLKQLVCINPHAVLKSRRDDFWPSMSDAEWLDMQRIIRRVTYTGPADQEQSSISTVRLRRIEGGFSGASVFSLRARTGSGQACVQAVLKVARTSETAVAESIRREVANYRRMVRWHLPYHWRPELLGAASSGHLEALCYAFVSTQEEQFETLRTFVRSGRMDVVGHTIESIFNPSRRRWYDARNVRPEAHLMRFYLDHCFSEGETSDRELEEFRKTLKDFDISAPDRVRVRDLEVRLPNLALFARPAGAYLSCPIHGDLNTSNVFVSPSGDGSDIMLIDFASTRRGHVFYDFIVFEVNLRLDCRIRGALNIHDRILQEREMNAGRPADFACAQEILRVRQCALANFANERKDSYLYGLAAFSFSLITSSNLSEIDRQILVSCTSAALMDLQDRRFWDAPPSPPSKPVKGSKRRQNDATDA